MGYTQAFKDRFWSRVVRSEGCWEWTGANVRGYGQISVGGRRRVYAHRASFELAHGPVPANKMVLHRCDNPPCCNPAHLYAGTAQDNTNDMYAPQSAQVLAR